MKLSTLFTIALAGFTGLISAHSWVDSVSVIGGPDPNNGAIGKVRGQIIQVERIKDDFIVHRMETPTAVICRPEQQGPHPTDLRLKVYPGTFVQASFLENGHISKPEQGNRGPGIIYWYGTTDPSTSTLPLQDIIKWNVDGTGGDGRGRLLAATSYDDGICIEQNDEAISKERVAKAVAAGIIPAPGNVPCVSQFKVPEDIETGKPYIIYWVWDFSTKVSNPNHFEWYSSCLDLDVLPKPAGKLKARGDAGIEERLVRSATFRGRL